MAPSNVLRCCQRVVGWIPVIFITLVACWSYYAYVVELCIFTIRSIGEKVIYLVVFHLSFVMFVWSYWKTIFTSPANPSKEFRLIKADKEQYDREERPEAQQEILRRAAKDLPVYTRTANGAIRYCDRCQVVKPDRCHHCSACDMCVLKMDHHCPWVNNCVGFSNYKYFMLFLAYSLLYCLFIAATVLQYFIKFWTLCRRKSSVKCPKGDLPDTHAKFHVLFLFFVAAMFFISLLSLFSYHCWLVSKNRSTIEAFRAPVFRNGPDKNGFSLGFTKNLKQVYGDQGKYWLLPIFTSLGDGCSYPTRLVSQDPEQPNSVNHTESAKNNADGQTLPPRPLSESQNRLLGGTDQHWIDEESDEESSQVPNQNAAVSIDEESTKHST
ncbi:palmitoyltransferase ZDHHC20-B-like isoform X1 [Stegostoma tigrinum]|uniref:palmitoyltransferase ZDHHC20-B-like isoform X1 n=1 Tax=Stegostoma tigrinum TaxID=3053191 RepID=UPI00202ADB5B|nr:palmitoyltransferase ZDHHC20-B-like isoform X1 [Stegostoma tigrinum]